MKISSICIIGGFNLVSANLGYEMAVGFSQAGIKSQLIIKDSHLDEWRSLHPGLDPFKDSFLRIVKDEGKNSIIRTLMEAKIAREFDLVFSLGLGGIWFLPFLGKPIVSYATGADLTELAGGKGYSGIQVKLAKRIFKKAKLVFHSIETGHTEMIKKLGIKNAIPWRQVIDTNFWKGEIKEKGTGLNIFHPTSLIWIPEFEGQRLKSNDVVFKGFQKFLNEGGKGKLFFRNRGQNIKETNELIKELQLEPFVEKLPDSSNREEQKKIMKKMDIVVDQFGVGNFGLIALEALAVGKPVIAYFPLKAAKQSYPEPEKIPPILNALSPDEVAKHLLEMSNSKKLYEQSKLSQDWINECHAPKILSKWYLEKINSI
jgi:hypothetical protein